MSFDIIEDPQEWLDSCIKSISDKNPMLDRKKIY